MHLSEQEIEARVAESYEVPNRVVEAVQAPLVTVRTSAYNHGPFIRQCIESVLMQKTNFPFEYIIGEDCSTDETREIVLEMAKKHPDVIRVITSDQNIGAKGNGRRTFRASRGKYMAMCEGDDFWIDEYKLQKQFDYMEKHPECGICATLGIQRDEINNTPDTIKPEDGAKVYRHDRFLSGKTGVLTASFFYRLEFYRKEVCFNPKILIGDWTLLACMTENNRTCAVLPYISVVYRQHAGGLWSGRKNDPMFKLKSLIVAFQEYLKVAPLSDRAALESHIDLLDAKIGFLSHEKRGVLECIRLCRSKAGCAFFGSLVLMKLKSALRSFLKPTAKS